MVRSILQGAKEIMHNFLGVKSDDAPSGLTGRISFDRTSCLFSAQNFRGGQLPDHNGA